MPSREQSVLPDRTLRTKAKCPNCGKMTYMESVSKEECTSCGLLCDYWGKGTNSVYRNMLDRKHAEQDVRDEEEQHKLMMEMYGDPDDA